MAVLVLDENPLLRLGIRTAIQMSNIYEKILEADTIDTGLKIIMEEDIDIAIVDLHLGEENGFDFIEKTIEQRKSVKFIIVTTSATCADVEKAKHMRLSGYLLKNAFVEDIIYTIKVVQRGGTFFSPLLAEREFIKNKKTEKLTHRERDVLFLLKRGMTNAQISKKLFISESTTKKHISNILAKLNMKHRVEVALYMDKIEGSWYENEWKEMGN